MEVNGHRCVTFVACWLWRDVTWRAPAHCRTVCWATYTFASTFFLLLHACKGRNNKYCIAFPVSVWLYFQCYTALKLLVWFFKGEFVNTGALCSVLMNVWALSPPPSLLEALYLFMHARSIRIVGWSRSVRFLCIERLFNCALLYFCLLNTIKLSLPVYNLNGASRIPREAWLDNKHSCCVSFLQPALGRQRESTKERLVFTSSKPGFLRRRGELWLQWCLYS